MALDFGVEIECFVPGQSGFQRRIAEGLARDITEAGVPTFFEGYNHQLRSHWKIVTDASLRGPPGFTGLEFVSPPLNDSTISQIDTVSAVLTRNGARTNKSCGLHVHIGARHLGIDTFRRLALLYIDHEDVIDSLMPPSRRRNNNERYLASPKASANIEAIRRAFTVKQLAGAIRGGEHFPSRFVKLNFTSHWKHGTVEFRQHSGTVDNEKIKRWVYFCQKLVDVAASDTPLPQVSQSAEMSPMQSAELTRRLAKIKVAASIYELACRPQGVTPTEARDALGWRNTPRPHIDLDRLGVAWYTDGTRNRQKVYKIRPGTVPTVTLASLLQMLGMEEEHAAFWRERVRIVGGGSARSENENPNPHYRAGDEPATYRTVNAPEPEPTYSVANSEQGASLSDILNSRRNG